jgi:hypothetical protein
MAELQNAVFSDIHDMIGGILKKKRKSKVVPHKYTPPTDVQYLTVTPPVNTAGIPKRPRRQAPRGQPQPRALALPVPVEAPIYPLAPALVPKARGRPVDPNSKRQQALRAKADKIAKLRQELPVGSDTKKVTPSRIARLRAENLLAKAREDLPYEPVVEFKPEPKLTKKQLKKEAENLAFLQKTTVYEPVVPSVAPLKDPRAIKAVTNAVKKTKERKAREGESKVEELTEGGKMLFDKNEKKPKRYK